VVGCTRDVARIFDPEDSFRTAAMRSLVKTSTLFRGVITPAPLDMSSARGDYSEWTLSSQLTHFWDLSGAHLGLNQGQQPSHSAGLHSLLQSVSRAQFIDVVDVNLRPSQAIAANPRLLAYYQSYEAYKKAQGLHLRERNFNISSFRCTRPAFSFTYQLFDAVKCFDRIDRLRSAVENEEYYQCTGGAAGDGDDYAAEEDYGMDQLEPLNRFTRSFGACHNSRKTSMCSSIRGLVRPLRDRLRDTLTVVENFVFVIPKVLGRTNELSCSLHQAQTSPLNPAASHQLTKMASRAVQVFYPSYIRQRIFFPDRKLIQFDAGKLQKLATLLRDLKKGGHKCLIFTQMSKMLDILEAFLNLYGHTYVRLDGSTSVDNRSKLMERFNADPKLFCFILSTRSGGLGINLTGADIVIFYDSDWNPAMDAQV
jgi:hypothetical protein